MTAALEVSEWSAARPDRNLPPEKNYPYYRLTSGPVWMGGKPRSNRDSIPDRPARNSVGIPTEPPGPYFLHVIPCNCPTSKKFECVLWFRGTAFWIPTWDIDICLLWVLRVFRLKSFVGLINSPDGPYRLSYVEVSTVAKGKNFSEILSNKFM